MTKPIENILTITRLFIAANALAMAVALPMWLGAAVAQTDVRSTSEGPDTTVRRTYDDKTGKLLKVFKSTETWDPKDRTKILSETTIRKYDQGKRPPYETTVERKEIVLHRKKRVLRKKTKISKTFEKTKQRELVIEVTEKIELAGLDAKGVPIYTGTRITDTGKGSFPQTNEVWDVRTRKWVRAGWTLEQFLEAQKKQLLEAERLISLNRPKSAGEKLLGVRDNRVRGSPADNGKHYAVDDELNRTRIIEKEKAKPEETTTARRQGDGANRTPAQQAPQKPFCDALGGDWHGGTLPMIEQIASDWKKALSRCTAGPDCPTFRGGASYQSYMQSLMIWQCHTTFVKYEKKASKDDREQARKEACAIEKTLEKMAEQIRATGFMAAGASWKPLHIDLREKWEVRDHCQPEKIEKAGGSGPKIPSKPRGSASSTETNTAVTTTSVANPDGSHTITKTDKDGNVLSKETVSKGPASVSSTERDTGITTKSIKNPDGTKTVTKTDKDGNVLSREIVGNEPASASSTVIKTGETTTSVTNPDGTRTLTKTDKDGNILSREKVR